ncbi:MULTISPECIES: spirocyclase AveC family protein [unclassified Nocardioides]|uniref:spirocyclase AveC family protein n=1 Tax=unclassified Nocardioides TaxID=2615069 RepID=UPI0006F78454|nr:MULTISPECIES: spirocyclase AveC family protein [unclassified Nocardioides]KRA37772.1 hypothetical protein ASD81_03485 [Nocardioides sp. Root614]KRA91732.1 hypothetical protein ASD84_03750 [Nocardioides sp. Root682]
MTTHAPATEPDRVVLERKPGALVFWSAFGALVTALATVAWVSWVFSGDFQRVDPGEDHYRFLWYLRTFEVVSVVVSLAMLGWFVVRPWRRERRVPIDGKILLGMMIAYYVDPILNVFNPAFAMNAHAVNFGSWAGFMPGYPSPDQERFAEGLLWAQPLYMYFGLLAAMGGCQILRLLRTRMKRASSATLYAILFVTFALADVVVEMVFIVYPQLYMFPGVPANFSLFAGEIYQFPLYQALFAAVFATMVTWLRDSVDATGRSAVERGVDDLGFSPLRRHATSFMAVTGFCTASALGYFLPYSAATMTADTYVELPSYLSPSAFCGVEGKPACPSEHLDQLQHGTGGK